MSHLSLVVFDGYRHRLEPGSGTIQSLREATGAPGVAHQNSWIGPGDSLADRLKRARSWLAGLADSGRDRRLHVVAYSMGCQIAVRFAGDIGPDRTLAGLDLIAPDPKYRAGAMDLTEAERGEVPAFEEARRLWGEDIAGPAFTEALRMVASATRCRVVYSRGDEIAEWPGNTERMRSGLEGAEGITWIEAEPGRTVRDNGVAVSVQPGDEIHQALAESVRFAKT